MSCVNFLFRGIEGQQKSYRRDQHPKEGSHFVQFPNAKKIAELSEKITGKREEGDYKYIKIDDAYEFNILKDEIRDGCSHIWIQLKDNSKKIGVVTGLIGIVGLTLIPMTPFISVAVTVGIISLGILGFSALSFYRFKQARDQLKLWDNPTDNFIQDCKKHFLDSKLAQAKANLEKSLKEPEIDKIKVRIIEEFKQELEKRISTISEYKSEIEKIQNGDLEKIASSCKDPIFIGYNSSIEMLNQKIVDIEKRIESDAQNQDLKEELEGNVNLKEQFIRERKECLEKIFERMKKYDVDGWQQAIQDELMALSIILKTPLLYFSKDEIKVMLQPYISRCKELKNLKI